MKTLIQKNQWTQYAKVIRGERTDENYREIKAGKGFFDEKNPDGNFMITGYISPSDAKLMAAAPDLLEALQLINESGIMISDEITAKMISAIKKATA